MDHPRASTPLHVLRLGSDEPLTSRVDRVTGDVLHIARPRDRLGRSLALVEGELLELSWQADDGLRSVSTEVIASAAGPSWRVQVRGPATKVQRREWVRAPAGFPVRLTWGAHELVGSTTDLSEGGCSFVFRPHAHPDVHVPPPQEGERMTVTLDLHSDVLDVDVELVRRVRRRGVHHEWSVTFVQLPEQTCDLIRSHVFTALRMARARSLGRLY